MKFITFVSGRSAAQRRGVTLLLTLLVLVIAVTVLSRQMLRSTVDRLNMSATPFTVESQWIADGVAQQWLERSQYPQDVDDLLQPTTWTWETSSTAPRMEIIVQPSSTQNKVYLPKADSAAWTQFWRSQPGTLDLADMPDHRLFETGNAALEVILAPEYISAQAAYLPSKVAQIAPNDVLTVWGNGRLDLNRCPLEVLRVQLKDFTDAQLSGIIRLRSQGPITRIEPLGDELSLSEDQAKLLQDSGTTHPECVELVIQIKKGGLRAVYHAALTLGKGGQVLEVRPIL